MPKAITFDRGSKRRLDQVQWKFIELLSLTLLAILVFGLSLLVMLWELYHEHPHEPITDPEIRHAEPTQR